MQSGARLEPQDQLHGVFRGGKWKVEEKDAAALWPGHKGDPE